MKIAPCLLLAESLLISIVLDSSDALVFVLTLSHNLDA